MSGAKLEAHLKHASDIVPAPAGGCRTSLLTVAAGGTALNVALTGEAETPAGDPVATGTRRSGCGPGKGRSGTSLRHRASAAAALIDEIIAGPAGFYVNVHTTEHPAGAMRAQLG